VLSIFSISKFHTFNVNEIILEKLIYKNLIYTDFTYKLKDLCFTIQENFIFILRKTSFKK